MRRESAAHWREREEGAAAALSEASRAGPRSRQHPGETSAIWGICGCKDPLPLSSHNFLFCTGRRGGCSFLRGWGFLNIEMSLHGESKYVEPVVAVCNVHWENGTLHAATEQMERKEGEKKYIQAGVAQLL